MEKIKLEGRRVIVRAYHAGVHFGTLLYKDGQEVHLKNARRLWNWQGALSLHEVAKNGVTLSRSKISEPLDEVVVIGGCEILPLMPKCNLPQ